MAFTHLDPSGGTYRERQSVHFSNTKPRVHRTCPVHPELPVHSDDHCSHAEALDKHQRRRRVDK